MPRRTLIGLLAALVALGAVFAPAAVAAKKKAKPKPFRVVTAQATQTSSVTGIMSATATCPPKTTAIGGGFANPPQNASSFFEPTESVRVDSRSWRASGVAAIAGGAPHTLTTEVRCAKVRGKIKIGTAVAPYTGSAPYFASAEAACPSGTRLVSGGFSASFPGLVIISVYRNNPTASGWSAGLITTVPTGALSVSAYCLKPAKKGKVRPKPLQQPTATTTMGPVPSIASIAAPSCSGKRKGIGGGWSSPDVAPGTAIPMVHTARFTGSAWTLGVLNYGSATGPITAHGLCG